MNLTELLSRVDNDRELLRDLLSIFEEDFPRHLQALQEAVERSDVKQVTTVSHTLKGMLSNLAVNRAAAAAGHLEQLARDEAKAALSDAFTAAKLRLHGSANVKGIERRYRDWIGIGSRLLLSIRSYDFVGRCGVEEFLMVLNNCKPRFAEARADEIRKAICGRPIQTEKGALQVTMSFGLLLSHDWGVRPVEELLHEVDAALYAAKAAGRNCFRVAKPALPEEQALSAQGAAHLEG